MRQLTNLVASGRSAETETRESAYRRRRATTVRLISETRCPADFCRTPLKTHYTIDSGSLCERDKPCFKLSEKGRSRRSTRVSCHPAAPAWPLEVVHRHWIIDAGVVEETLPAGAITQTGRTQFVPGTALGRRIPEVAAPEAEAYIDLLRLADNLRELRAAIILCIDLHGPGGKGYRREQARNC